MPIHMFCTHVYTHVLYMSMHMCIHVRMNICIDMSVHTSIQIPMHMCTHMPVYISTRKSMRKSIHMSVPHCPTSLNTVATLAVYPSIPACAYTSPYACLHTCKPIPHVCTEVFARAYTHAAKSLLWSVRMD